MNMSFALTTEPMRNYAKTCTRRYGWKNIYPAQILWAVEKGMGLKKGEKIKRIHEIQVLHNRWEPANRMIKEPEYGESEVIKEGFPNMRPAEFVEMLCDHNHKLPNEPVNRIEFRFLLRKIETLIHTPTEHYWLKPHKFEYQNDGTLVGLFEMNPQYKVLEINTKLENTFRFEFE